MIEMWYSPPVWVQNVVIGLLLVGVVIGGLAAIYNIRHIGLKR